MRNHRLVWKGALIVAAPLLVGCGSSPSLPSSPSGGTPVQLLPNVPQVTNPSSAVVAIEDPFVTVRSEGPGSFVYGVWFLLRETSGRSSATIGRVVVYGPDGSDETSEECWGDPLRVPAGGELDTFHTYAGYRHLGYCSPGSGGLVESPVLHVVITFRDDDGVVGSVGAPITALR